MPLSSSIQTVGFVGTGVMGRSMAGHLLDAGCALRVHNRTRDKAADLLRRGATWCATPGEAAAGSDVVFTIVGYPRDVEEVYQGADGLLARARPGTVLVDMTTSSPELARRLAAAGSTRGVEVLDAPVTGGDKGAREATLTILVGGSAAAFERVRPLLAAIGRNIVRFGDSGAGQHAKLANQIAIAGTLQGVCEAMAYARGAGLDAGQVLAAIAGGAAASWQLQNLGPKMLSGDFAPGFYVKHLIKDLELALAEGARAGLDLPSLRLALERYRELAAAGGAEQGTQALFRLYGAA
jgi:3-hydroxyisobutyrate dehydrogenase